MEDYDSFYKNKKLENYKIFFELISEDNIQEFFVKENLNDTKKNFSL